MRVSIADLLGGTQPQPSWLVEDIFPTHQIVVIAGEAGVGKSFFCYSLGLAVAGGLAFLGKSTRRGRVLVFDEENGLPDLSSYIFSLWRGYGSPPIESIGDRLRVEHFSMNGDTREDVVAMSIAVKEHAPDLLIFDTMGSVLPVKDENDNAEAARHYRIVRHIKNHAPDSCTALVLKHARIDRKTGHRDVRGAKDWKGKADGVLFLGRERGRPRGDGLNCTYLEPLKVRAFGLKNRLKIEPRKIPQPPPSLEIPGILLSASVCNS